MDAVLELQELTKRFEAKAVVDGVSLAVERGCFFSLVGPSGCGKSTTLRLIAGLVEATSGDILLNGSSIAHVPPHKRPVNTVFQNYALFPHLTVRGNIAFGLERRSIAAAAVRHKVERMMEMLHLQGKEERKPVQLSGGERQRVALARSLVLEPEVLLLDEPLAALDPTLRQYVRGELRQLQRHIGTTFILVTHDRDEALSMSDIVAVMNAGRIEQAGTPQELYARPRTRCVAGFLGAINWVGDVGIRPEHVRVTRNGSASHAANHRSAVVAQQIYLGSAVHLVLRLSTGETMVADVPASTGAFAEGEGVNVTWSEGDELLGVSG